MRGIIFQTNTAFYFAYISISGYYVQLQSLDRYESKLLVVRNDGGIYLENFYAVGILSLAAACSAIHFPPKFRIAGIKLPTVSNGDVLTTLITAGILRNFLVFGFLLLLTLLSLDIAFLEAKTSDENELWPFDEETSFALRFILGYSVLPIFSFFLLFRSASTIIRMLSGNLTKYRPEVLNAQANKYRAHASRRRFTESSNDD